MSVVIREVPVAGAPRAARPEWLRVRVPGGEEYARIRHLIGNHRLHTVCEEARCPNMAECWNAGPATFMILGDTCTRSCGFCAVKTGRPSGLDLEEPYRVAEAIRIMGVPVIALFLGWLILDEKLNFQIAIAAAVFIAGVFIVNQGAARLKNS